MVWLYVIIRTYIASWQSLPLKLLRVNQLREKQHYSEHHFSEILVSPAAEQLVHRCTTTSQKFILLDLNCRSSRLMESSEAEVDFTSALSESILFQQFLTRLCIISVSVLTWLVKTLNCQTSQMEYREGTDPVLNLLLTIIEKDGWPIVHSYWCNYSSTYLRVHCVNYFLFQLDVSGSAHYSVHTFIYLFIY